MSETQLQFNKFVPQHASDRDYDDAIMLRHAERKEYFPDTDLPPKSRTRNELENLENSLIFIPELHLVRLRDKAIGRIELLLPRPESSNYEARAHNVVTRLYVHPDLRRQGYGTQLLRWVTQYLDKQGYTRMGGNSRLLDGMAFAKSVGASVALDDVESHVYWANLDWDLIEQWKNEGEARNPDTKITLFDGLYSNEDAELQKFCDLSSSVMRDIPSGDVVSDPTDTTIEETRNRHEIAQQRGVTETYMVTIEPNGQLSALTKIKYYEDSPEHLRQGITGVVASERGRGLAKWLKAAMLLHVKDRYPEVEYISTGNSSINAPMRAINERMGFKVKHRKEFYKLMIADAKERLSIS